MAAGLPTRDGKSLDQSNDKEIGETSSGIRLRLPLSFWVRSWRVVWPSFWCSAPSLSGAPARGQIVGAGYGSPISRQVSRGTDVPVRIFLIPFFNLRGISYSTTMWGQFWGHHNK